MVDPDCVHDVEGMPPGIPAELQSIAQPLGLVLPVHELVTEPSKPFHSCAEAGTKPKKSKDATTIMLRFISSSSSVTQRDYRRVHIRPPAKLGD
jgi:hypothetical protein